MSQYLFLFTIGPVQSFIAQARKTQDLYAGSKILSDLAKEGLRVAKPKEMIFPIKTSTPSVPNRFLCIIEDENPKQKGKEIEKAVQDYWKDVIAKDLKPYYKDFKGIEQQIDAHLDINWAFVEITEGYQKAYEKIERLLGAVKNARSFEQFDYQGQLGEKGRKCSLDGERNVKFYRLNEKERTTDVLAKKLFMSNTEVEIINNTDEDTFHFSKLQAGEGLSAVSMAKRLFKEYLNKKDFDSTAGIALKHQIDILSTQNKKLYDCYKQLFSYEYPNACINLLTEQHIDKITIENKNGNWRKEFDDQLLFEENLTAKNIPNETQLKLAKCIQGKLKKYLTHKYYAIIDFDGDSMGKWLSGDKDKLKESIDLKTFHQDLSSKLADFAKEAKKIVDNYGQTVYAGGDDFLGFVNLNYVFEAMTKLRNEYDKIVNVPLLKYRKEGQNLSFSAGVCIAHYKEPLSMVLDKAGKAQKTAKHDEKGKRNAFSIVASKHSGENHEAYFNWGTSCQSVTHLGKVIEELIKPYRFSNTFIKNLNIEFARLVDNNGKLTSSQRELLEAEVERLLRRSFMGNKEDKKIESETFTQSIMAIYDVATTYNNFINALNICDFMHRLLSAGETQNIQKQELETA